MYDAAPEQQQKSESDIRDTYISDIWVQKRFIPADEATEAFLVEMLEALGLGTSSRCQCALADLFKAATYDKNRLVVWPRGKSNRTKPYSTRIMQDLQDALRKHNKITVALESTRERATTYQVIEVPDFLKFKEHNLNNGIRLRAEKPKGYYGGMNKAQGREIYDAEMTEAQRETRDQLTDRLRVIQDFLKLHPLKSNRSTWDHVYRVFNGSFEQGGRFQGGWVNRPKKERFSFTIDGQPIIQVDVKACFFFLVHALKNVNQPLPCDPYEPLQSFKGFKISRDAVKAMVSKFLSHGSLKSFPQTHKKDENGNTINFRDYHSLPKGFTAKDFETHLFATYPWIRGVDQRAGELMYMESSIMEEVLLRLVEKGIPAYPLHYCLIGKATDEAVLVEVLQEVFEDKLGKIPYLEVEYSLHNAKVISPPTDQQEQDDFDSASVLIEDDDLIDEGDNFL